MVKTRQVEDAKIRGIAIQPGVPYCLVTLQEARAANMVYNAEVVRDEMDEVFPEKNAA